MTQNAEVLFRLEADATGAVRGFTLSREELDKLRKAANEQGDESTRAARKTKKHGDAVQRTGRQARSTSRAMNGLKTAVAAVFTVAALRQVTAYADTMKNLEARLRIVTASELELAQAREETFAISQRTSASIESTVELYARLELSLKGVGVAQSDLLSVTETINMAMVASGASAQEANAAVIQLSQGLAAGALRGDEFRSVAEQSPRILQALQASLGKTRGELKALADDGKLVTEVIVAALLEQSGAIEEEFSKLPITVGRAFTQLRNEVLKFISGADQATGASAKLAQGIVYLSQNLDKLTNIALAGAIAALSYFTAKMIAAGVSAVATGGGLTALLGPLGWIAAAVGIGAFALLQYRDATQEAGIATTDMISAIKDATNAFEISAAVDEAREGIEALETEADNLKEQFLEIEAEQAGEGHPDPRRRLVNFFTGKTPDELEADKQQVLADLEANDLAQKRLKDSIAEGRVELEALDRAQGDAAQSAADLLRGLDGAGDAAKKYAAAVKSAEQAILSSGDAQARIGVLQAQHSRTLAALEGQLKGTAAGESLLAQATAALERELRDNIQAVLDETDSVLILEDAINELGGTMIDATESAFVQLEVMLETLANRFGEDSEIVAEYTERIRQLRLEAEQLGGTSATPDLNRGFMSTLNNAFERGGKSLADSFSEAMKSDPLGAANMVLGSIAGYQARKDSGMTSLDALNQTIAAAGIPVVSEIAQALDFVNQIFGGGLFGTKFETKETRRSFAFTGSGAAGGYEYDQSKKKSLFRGTSRRTKTEGLEGAEQAALDDLYDSALVALTGAAETLGTVAPEFIAGTFKETFDKEGNLVSSASEFLGKVYEESFEEFGQRLIAEQIIATVDQVTNASEIAERWRESADKLAEGAQVLLVAQTAIQAGEGLFESLALTVDVVEDLANAGEPLTAAYNRIIESVEILEESLGLVNLSLELSREEFVRFAEGLTEAAGGVKRAGELWAGYFSVFYEGTELVEARLRIANQTLTDELADVGLAPGIGKDQFRALFESVLPTLSAEAVVEWLEAGEALGTVLNLTEKLNEARDEEAEKLTDLIAAFEDAQAAIDEIIGGTIRDLRHELLSPEQIFTEVRESALGAADRIASAESREEVLAIVNEINQLTRDARSAAGDSRFNMDLITFLEQVGEYSGARLGELREEAIAEHELRNAEVSSRQSFVDSTTSFGESVALFASTVEPVSAGPTIGEQVSDGIREGFDPAHMSELMRHLSETVQTMGDIVRFYAEHPPTIEVETSSGGDDLGLS